MLAIGGGGSMGGGNGMFPCSGFIGGCGSTAKRNRKDKHNTC